MTKSLIYHVISSCPIWIIKCFCRIAGFLHYHFDNKHVKECEELVRLVDRGWNPKQTIRGMYRSVWSILPEVLWFQNNNDATCLEKISGNQELFDYLDEIAKDKGIIFVSCHIGNWEIGSRIISRYYRPLSSAFKPHNKEWVNRLILSFRDQHRQTTIPKDGGLLQLVRKLKQNEAIGLLIDQHGGEKGIDSEFLGKPCKSWDSAVQLSHRTKCPLVPVVYVRQHDKIQCHFIKDYQLSLNEQGKLDVQKSVFDLDRALSELVSKAPEQWLWLGRRWSRDYKTIMKLNSSPT